MVEYGFLVRVLVAGICGALIGYERKSRQKEAGIRTHFVVAVGACLMMILSKYGFRDQSDWPNLSLDPSRIAAQVVSGVGFLGAGMIFMQGMTVKGLTTAAGIWATAGMGMAMGAGLYYLAAGVTLIILAAQTVLHGRWIAAPKTERLVLKLSDAPGMPERIGALLAARKIAVLELKMEKPHGEGVVVLDLTVRLAPQQSPDTLLTLMGDLPELQAIEVK